MPVITALYAGLLGLLAMVLAYRAGSLRGRLNVAIGDGGNRDLLLAMRRHANFVEWVPLALILIALLELNGVPAHAIHALGAILVVSRILHAAGFKADALSSPARLIGAAGTALVTVVAAVWAIVTYLHH